MELLWFASPWEKKRDEVVLCWACVPAENCIFHPGIFSKGFNDLWLCQSVWNGSPLVKLPVPNCLSHHVVLEGICRWFVVRFVDDTMGLKFVFIVLYLFFLFRSDQGRTVVLNGLLLITDPLGG